MKKLQLLIVLSLIFVLSCNQDQKKRLSQEATTEYINKGNQIAGSSFKALASELKAALARGGIPEAIDYCNVQAMPITDSLSEAYNAEIRRTSLKTRNPENKPTEIEKEILLGYQKLQAQGDTLRPAVHLVDNNKILFTAPIMVQPLCLNCHGEVGKALQEKNYEMIAQRYPQDQATGYNAGDFRGMWSIRFDRE